MLSKVLEMRCDSPDEDFSFLFNIQCPSVLDRTNFDLGTRVSRTTRTHLVFEILPSHTLLLSHSSGFAQSVTDFDQDLETLVDLFDDARS